MSDPRTDNYVKRVLVAFDQFVNVVFNGHPDETISARTGRDAACGYKWALTLQWMLNTIQRHHTSLAIEHDKDRAEIVDHIEQGFENKSGGVKPSSDPVVISRVRD